MVRKTERKKLSMKTRLVIIAAMFIVVNLAFYVGSEFSGESKSEKQIEQPSQSEESEESVKPEETLYYKFNPPSSSSP